MNYLIDFADTMTPVEMTDYMALNEMTLIKDFDSFNGVFLVSAETEPAVNESVLSVVLDDSNAVKLLDFTIDYAQNQLPAVTIDNTNEANWWKLASIFSPNLDDATETHELRGAGLNIYLMDSGILDTHPEFADATISKLHSFTGDFTDTNGHGTALASVMVGKTCGLSNAEVKVVKIFDKNVETKQSDLLAALDAIIVDFRNNDSVPSVVNMSWNIAKNEYIENKINAMIQQGIVVVAAAGNDGLPISDVTPASMELVLTVGAYNSEFIPCDFSNYTDESAISVTANSTNYGALDGWAPGENILAATIDGTLAHVAGTSVAAAIHSAAVAYNLRYLLDSSGNYLPDLTVNSLVARAKYLSFSKPHLLTLDEKHAQSVNKITTYFTHVGDRPPFAGADTVFIVGERVTHYLFDMTGVKQVKGDADIPAGITLEQGKLTGVAEQIDGEYFLREVKLTIVMENDDEIPFDLRIAITTPEFDKETAEEGVDPILDIILSLCEDCCLNAGRTGCTFGSPGCGLDAPVCDRLQDVTTKAYYCECFS